MRIALVTTSWPSRRGDPAGHFVLAEARALERAGHSVTVVAPPERGAFGWPGVAARVREQPWRALHAAWWIAAARRRVRRTTADHIVAHWAVPCAWPIAVAARAVPIEVVSHGGDVRALGALPVAARAAVVDAIASRATRWRFVSESLMRDLLGGVGARERTRVERIAAVESAAIDLPDVRAEATLRRRALGGLRVAVSVGRLVAGKRVDRAIEHVARSRDLDALVVVGDGPERRRLERLARALGADVRFVGLVSREEALAWIGAADVLLHASQAEGLSTVVREAEALATPVERLGD